MTAHVSGRISGGCSDMLLQACMAEATSVARRLITAEVTHTQYWSD